jgi:hypothetical protein
VNLFQVNRKLPTGRYRLGEVFSGLEMRPLLRCIKDEEHLKQILDATYVSLTDDPEYMYVNDEDGSLIIGLSYLRTGDLRYIYLDIIHELVHVKQYRDGRELFDKSYNYVDRPTEIEAYACCIEEGRRIGMSEETLADYLQVEWITRDEHRRLLNTLGVQVPRHDSTLAKTHDPDSQ